MKFDFDNLERPLYLQIADEIKDEVLKGTINEEEQIPSSTEISLTFKINPATVNKGVNLLVEDGIIYKKRGIGMFVTTGAKDKIRKERSRDFGEKFIKPLLLEADKLGLTRDEIIKLIDKPEEIKK